MSESIQYWATTNAGNANSDPAISSSDTQAPNTVATNIRSLMTALAKARLDIFGGGLTAGGSVNALTVTTNQVLISGQLTGGAALMIKAASTNTSATVTFAPDGLTAAAIKRADGSALAVGSIQAGMFLFLVYNSGTSEWWAANIPPEGFVSISTLTDGATVAMGAATSAGLQIYRLTNATATSAITAPTSAIDGQRLILEITASGANRSPTLSTGFIFGTDITAIPTITSGKTLEVGAIYNATQAGWRVLGVNNGF